MVETEVDLCPMIFFSVSDYVIFLHPAPLLPHIYSHGHICLVKSRGMLKRCAFLYTLWRCHSSFLNSQSNSAHLMIKCKSSKLLSHGRSKSFVILSSQMTLMSLGVDSINKKGGCINSLCFICLSCIPGHNYNRALVAASIGSYGAYLADGSEYRLALLLVVLILAHELEVVEDAECKFI
uniref:Uncharacterized protein n=1 Tax=Cucumis melo TaxID=3656 RepID=A0A9I9EH38_CUCME